MAQRCFLVAAGAAEWDREGRLIGRRDVALSAEGRDEVAALAERFAVAQASGLVLWEIVTSPLQRAVRTAEAIGEATGLEPARDQRLTAIDAGSLQGRLVAELVTAPEQDRLWRDPDQPEATVPGESRISAVKRLRAAIEQARESSAAALVVVADAAIIELILADICEPSPPSERPVAPGTVTTIDFGGRPGTWSLVERETAVLVEANDTPGPR